MTTLVFDYYLMRRQDNLGPSPSNVLMVARRTRPVQAVCWGYRHGTWEFRPDVAATWLDPDRDDLILDPVDRETAERAAAQFTRVPLPTEEDLTEICRTAPRRPTTRMTNLAFGYHLLMRPDSPDGPAANVLAVAQSVGPTQAVSWDYDRREWNFSPDVAATWLYADREDLPIRVVDRRTAERATANFTDVPLPSEEELTRICRAAGPNWRPGMPR